MVRDVLEHVLAGNGSIAKQVIFFTTTAIFIIVILLVLVIVFVFIVVLIVVVFLLFVNAILFIHRKVFHLLFLYLLWRRWHFSLLRLLNLVPLGRQFDFVLLLLLFYVIIVFVHFFKVKTIFVIFIFLVLLLCLCCILTTKPTVHHHRVVRRLHSYAVVNWQAIFCIGIALWDGSTTTESNCLLFLLFFHLTSAIFEHLLLN